MLRLKAAFFLIVLSINMKSCENNLKMLKQEIKEINREVDKEEAQVKKEEQKKEESKFKLPAGMTYYTVAPIKMTFAYPKTWKIVIYSEERKNIDIEFKIPKSQVKAYLKAEASPGVMELTDWQNGRFLKEIKKLSEFEGKLDNAELLKIGGILFEKQGTEYSVNIGILRKYDIIMELSLKGKQPEFQRYAETFDQMINSVRFEKRYQIDL